MRRLRLIFRLPTHKPVTTKRPISVTTIGALFFVAGFVGLAYHATELKSPGRPPSEVILVLFIRLLAVIGALFLFRGANWVRWLLVLWMAYHTVLSFFHPLSELLIHALLLVVIAYFLFHRPAANYFTKPKTLPTPQPSNP